MPVLQLLNPGFLAPSKVAVWEIPVIGHIRIRTGLRTGAQEKRERKKLHVLAKTQQRGFAGAFPSLGQGSTRIPSSSCSAQGSWQRSCPLSRTCGSSTRK